MATPSTNNLPAVNQYDVNKYIISPLFLGDEMMSYMDVLPNIKGTTVIDHLGKLTKVTKAFNNGAFSGENAGTFSGVTISPSRVEAEIEFRASSLFGKIKGQLMRSGTDFDNIDGTIVKTALLDLIGTGIKYDFNRQLIFSDVASTDADYGLYDGLFQAAAEAVCTQLTSTNLSGSADNAGLVVAGGGLEVLKDMYDAASPELLSAPNRVFMVNGAVADSYQATLEANGYAAAGYGALVDGGKMSFRGIPIVVRRDWDVHMAADHAKINFMSAAAENYSAILTCQNAFIVGTDFDETQAEQWYSQDEKSYRFRVSYMIGCALGNSELAVVYTPDAITVG
jgi:hypothetical protein